MYQFIGSKLPQGLRKTFKGLFYYSGIEFNSDKFLGFLMSFGIMFSVAVALSLHVLFIFSAYLFIGLAASMYLLLILIAYMVLWFSAESKSKFVESVLPDALNLMAVNIKSGMTTDRAFLLSARPEFGPLEKEMRESGKRIISGTEVRTALLEMSRKVKSELFERTIKLIVEGMESGGELAKLLEETSEDIQKTKIAEREVKANLMMYVIFIFFASAIAVPVIYGISTNIVDILIKKSAQFDPSKAASQAIPPGFLVLYSIISITVTGIFSSLIIGLIKDGKGKAGAKYIPLILALSISLFFITKAVIGIIFPSV